MEDRSARTEEPTPPTPSAACAEAAGCAHADLVLPGVASLPPLRTAVQSGNHVCLRAVRGRFEELNGPIVNCYLAPTAEACAVLVRRPSASWPEPREHLLIWIDRKDLAIQVSAFADVLWRTLWLARRAEGTKDSLLPPEERKVVTDMLFAVAVVLLGSLDVVRRTPQAHAQDLERAARTANAELDKLEHYIDRAAIRATFRVYLFGLPLGIALLAVPVAILFLVDFPGDVRQLLLLSIIAGGIGAITSVMVRITRGQKLSVDTRQGRWVTLFAGVFRPLVGAVFGVALYILVVGGLLPVATSPQTAHFYAGLAFLAGFSERWAQDTIVRSAPIAPSPATRAPATDPPGGPMASGG